jgi:hypothetical protein
MSWSAQVGFTFFNVGAKWGGWAMSSSNCFIPKEEVWFELYKRLHGWSGCVQKISTLPGFVLMIIRLSVSRYTNYGIRCAIHTHTYTECARRKGLLWWWRQWGSPKFGCRIIIFKLHGITRNTFTLHMTGKLWNILLSQWVNRQSKYTRSQVHCPSQIATSLYRMS